MTPKEKAKELYNKLIRLCQIECEHEYAIECALIAVDEILKSEPILPNNQKPFGKKIQSIRQNFIDAHEFWQEVKKELEAMK